MTSIAELLDRVRAATGPDWKLDGDLHVTLAGSEPTRDRKSPPYTASVDAALSLVERELPGWRWGVSSAAVKDGTYPDGKAKYADGFKAHLTEQSALRPMPSTGEACAPALAIIAALLSALSNEVQP